MVQICDPNDSALSAFRRIARRKLVERGYPEGQIEAKIDELLRKGLPIEVAETTPLPSPRS